MLERLALAQPDVARVHARQCVARRRCGVVARARGRSIRLEARPHDHPALIGLGVVGALAMVGIAWRLASRRQSLPCPVWLRWFVELDNPFTSTNRSNVIVAQLDNILACVCSRSVADRAASLFRLRRQLRPTAR